MKQLSKDSVNWLQVEPEEAGQRIDNYLMRQLKGVPKSHLYRILRSGEVRVNSGRVGPQYRVQEGDRVRVPPVRTAQRSPAVRTMPVMGELPEILYEDAGLLIVNKPAGLAVHGGSGIAFGVIERLRAARPQGRFLELVHRLDRDTSGILLLAKKRSALTALHEQLRQGHVRKIYLAMVRGVWRDAVRAVRAPLLRQVRDGHERHVTVSEAGQPAHTVFRLQNAWPESEPPMSLLEAELKTGRTHQIRVHLAHLGFPILGDEKYGDFALNKKLVKKHILMRMFLHASEISFSHPESGESLQLRAPLPRELLLLTKNPDQQKLNQRHAQAV